MDVNKEILNENLNEKLENTEIELKDDREAGREANVRKILLKILVGAAYIFFAYLLGGAEIFFDAKPFGIALLSVASHNVAYIYIGLCLSAIVGGDSITVYICAYTITVLIRILSRIIIDNNPEKDKNERITLGDIFPLLFKEHICLRMATSCIGAFIIGVYMLVSGGFYYYDLWGAILGMIIAPAAVLLYFGFMGSETVSPKIRFASLCALSASLVFASRELLLAGASPAICAAMVLTLYFCRKKGPVYGLIMGAVCGLAYSPILAPSFILAAVAACALWKISGFFACLAAASVGFAWALYAEGISALTEVLPAMLATALLFAVVDKLYLTDFFEKTKNEVKDVFEVAEKKRSECVPLGEEALGSVILDDTEQKIKIMCETFSSLSSLFYSLSERMRSPASADLKEICDSAFDACCQGCEMRCTCWEVEYANSLAAVNKICGALSQNGHITESDVAPRMYERCSSMPDIIDQINRNSMLHMQQLIIGDKTEIFALDYEAVSELLASSMVDQREEFEILPALSGEISGRFCELGIAVDGVLAYGNDRRKNIVVRASSAPAIFSNVELISKTVGEICGSRLDMRQRSCDDGRSEIIFSTARRYRVEYAKRSLKADGEEGFCGDTINVFENGQDKFYSFISDGMGSGREAALTSGICSVFLSKILGTTSKCDVSLKMLNGFLRNKGSGSMHECSATVDLMEFDLITGAAAFYKGGAAPSYVYRDGNLFKLRSNSVPLGIIKELDTRKISFELGDGDIVVMVSDGVTQAKDECPWLFDLLRANVGKESLASISDMIVKRAKYEGADDDISVVVMKIGR